MKRNILSSIALLLALMLVPAGIGGGVAYAACGNPSGSPVDSKGQVLNSIGETGSNCSDTGVKNIVVAVVKILSFVVGVISIIMVVVGGFRYTTSGGDGNKIANAKSTLLYALVGVVIAALAQFLIHFVFTESIKAAG